MGVAPRLRALLAAASMVLAAGASAQDDAAAEALFRQQCGVCHAAAKGEAHRLGPTLWGVTGRKAGSSAGFTYSPAFRKKLAGRSWSDARLDGWLADAQAMVPGSTMAYRQADETKRAAVVAYLKTLQ